MKALKTRRRRVAPAPIPPSLQLDLQGEWRRYTRLLPMECVVLDVVTNCRRRSRCAGAVGLDRCPADGHRR